MMNNVTKLRLPFAGQWFVLWGGDTEKLNLHHNIPAQRQAFDFVMHDERGNSHRGTGADNEDYYAFSQDVLAPAAGIVIEVVQGIRDNKPLQTNLFAPGGNYILIKHGVNEYSFIAHLKQDSTLVRPGDSVKSGQKIGECGNSGNSSEPHIHYHLQTSDIHSIFDSGQLKPIARGIKVYFSDVTVKRGSETVKLKKHPPIRGDVVSANISE